MRYTVISTAFIQQGSLLHLSNRDRRDFCPTLKLLELITVRRIYNSTRQDITMSYWITIFIPRHLILVFVTSGKPGVVFLGRSWIIAATAHCLQSRIQYFRSLSLACATTVLQLADLKTVLLHRFNSKSQIKLKTSCRAEDNVHRHNPRLHIKLKTDYSVTSI